MAVSRQGACVCGDVQDHSRLREHYRGNLGYCTSQSKHTHGLVMVYVTGIKSKYTVQSYPWTHYGICNMNQE